DYLDVGLLEDGLGQVSAERAVVEQQHLVASTIRSARHLPLRSFRMQPPLFYMGRPDLCYGHVCDSESLPDAIKSLRRGTWGMHPHLDLVEQIPDGLAVFQTERTCYVNQRLLRLAGFEDCAELLGRDLLGTLFAAPDQAELRAMCDKLL